MEIYSSNAPILVSAASRKTHNFRGEFDIQLPLTGPPGIECRSGGANGDYTMVVTFDRPVILPGAEVICGTGSVSSVTGSGTNVLRILLTGMGQPMPCGGYIVQTNMVRLNQVEGGSGPADFTIPMGVLIGDVNADGVVNVKDTDKVYMCLLSPAIFNSTNFRCDLDTNGMFDCTLGICPDVVLAKCYSGSGLW
jgi:hypothetical protein